ncbi:hypothetical protein JCM19240_4279 [Vibrio maritimus]|uniref:OsmC/Ohr family protein n=1 Tax=Vibrio maritimus TaxID=990268 RepID=A0A090T7J4_9VIBR|nr:hypothetical protein JCM19240_4279 [Vibrio maritimus]
MTIKVKPASYGPLLVSTNDSGALVYGFELETLSPTPSLESPAETLLYSIGSCMVLSLQMVAKRKKIDIEPFYVEVIGHKGTELPAHFARYEIALSQGIHSDETIALKLLRDAKKICTISNSLSGSFELTLKEEQ